MTIETILCLVFGAVALVLVAPVLAFLVAKMITLGHLRGKKRFQELEEQDNDGQFTT